MFLPFLPWIALVGVWVYERKLSKSAEADAAAIRALQLKSAPAATPAKSVAVTPTKSMGVSAHALSEAVRIVSEPPPPMPVVLAAPQQLSDNPLNAVSGQFYRATVVVHFPASLAANANKVKAQAESQGFTNVAVTTRRPSNWPGASGDYYVSATYAGAPKPLNRVHGGGQVNITDVWQG